MLTAHSVQECHMIIKLEFGTFEEDDKAFDKVMILTSAMLLFAMIGRVEDAALMAMMMTVLQPWRRVLQEVMGHLRYQADHPHTWNTTQQEEDKKGQVQLYCNCICYF